MLCKFEILYILIHIFPPVSPSQSSSSGIASSSSFSSGPGFVSKVHMNMFCGQNHYAIYRKNGEIPTSFRANVRKAMKEIPEYDVLDYNCIHFAMELLDVDLQVIHSFSRPILMIMTHNMYVSRENKGQ